MERIDQITGPAVVGKFYLVYCIKVSRRPYDPIGPTPLEWIPVLGPAHWDAEIGADFEHYHYDLRFISLQDAYRIFALPQETIDYALSATVPDALNIWDLNIWEKNTLYQNARSLFGRVVPTDRLAAGAMGPPKCPAVLKRRKLYRQMPVWPIVSTIQGILEPLHRDRQISPGCHTCPHKGVSLAGLPVDADGCVVCPGHGLKFNLTTGRLVPRATAEPAP